MTVVLQKPSEAEFAGYRAEQHAGFEVDLLRRRQSLTVGITVQLGDVVPRIGCGVAIHRIGIQNADYLGHGWFSSLGFLSRHRVRAILPQAGRLPNKGSVFTFS